MANTVDVGGVRATVEADDRQFTAAMNRAAGNMNAVQAAAQKTGVAVEQMGQRFTEAERKANKFAQATAPVVEGFQQRARDATGRFLPRGSTGVEPRLRLIPGGAGGGGGGGGEGPRGGFSSVVDASAAVSRSQAAIAHLGDRAANDMATLKQRVREANAEAAKGDMERALIGVTAAATAASIAIGAALRSAVMRASDFNEQTNVIEQSFGKTLTPQIDAWAKETATAFSRSQGQVRNFAGQLQALTTPMLGSREKAARLSTEFTKLAIDMGSFFNVADSDALVALKAGLVGETEPLRRFGINMIDASLNAYAMSKGIRTTVEQMDDASKVALRYSFILDHTKDVQGDAIRTQSSLENSLKALSGSYEDLQVAIGTPLLGKVAGVVQGLTKATRAAAEADPALQSLAANGLLVAGGFTTAAAAAGVLLLALPTLIASFGALELALSMALGATVSLGAVLGIAAAAAAGVAVAFTAASVALDALGAGMPGTQSYLDGIAQAFDTDTSAAKEAAKYVDELTAAHNRLHGAARPLMQGTVSTPPTDPFEEVAQNLASIFDRLGAGVDRLVGSAGKVSDVLDSLGSSMVDGSTNADDYRQRVEAASGATRTWNDAITETSSNMGESTISATEAANAIRKIGEDLAATQAKNATTTLQQYTSAVDKATSALARLHEEQARARGAAAVGRAPESLRPFQQTIADAQRQQREFEKNAAEVNKQLQLAAAARANMSREDQARLAPLGSPITPGQVSQQRVDIAIGKIDDFASQLARTPIRDFGELLQKQVEWLRREGVSDRDSARLQGIRPVDPARATLGADARTLAGLGASIMGEPFADLATNARAAQAAIGEWAIEMVQSGARTSDILEGVTQKRAIAEETLVAQFNGQVSSLDDFDQAMGAVREACEALGISFEGVRGRLRASPQSIGDLLSRDVGKLVDGMKLNFAPGERKEMVSSISNGIADLFKGGGIDMSALGGILGRAAGAAGLLGAAGGPAGAAIGAAVGTIASQVAASIDEAVKSVIAATVGLTGDARLTKAADTSMGPGGAVLLAAFFAPITASIAIVVAELLLVAAVVATVLAPLTAFVVLLGAIGAFLSLASETKSFAKFQRAFAAVTDSIIDVAEPFAQAFLPMAGLFEAFAKVVLPLFASFAAVEPAARVLFEVLQTIAVVFGAVVIAAASLQFAVLSVVAGLAVGMAGFLSGVKNLLAPLGMGGLVPDDVVAGLNSLAIAANAMKPNLDAMAKALVDLTGLTYEEAMQRAEILAKEKDLSEELTNVPQGFKVAAARLRAVNADSALNASIIATGGLTAGQALSTTYNIDTLNVTAQNPEELQQALERRAERKSFQQRGTTATKDAQNNGR